MRSFGQWLLGVSALVWMSVPSAAWACPYCATRDDAGVSGTILLGAMIALPFVVFLAVFPTLRRVASVDSSLFPSDSE
jgi:hypothetical protein